MRLIFLSWPFRKDKLSFIEGLRSLAIGGFAFGALFWIPAISFYAGSAATAGRIVKMAERDSSDRMVWYPVFTYQDSTGRAQTVTSTTGFSNSTQYQPGQAVQIRYRPERLSDARFDSFFSIWGTPVLIQGICLGHIVIWSIALHYLRRRCERGL
jgi:hypothetical protein